MVLIYETLQHQKILLLIQYFPQLLAILFHQLILHQIRLLLHLPNRIALKQLKQPHIICLQILLLLLLN